MGIYAKHDGEWYSVGEGGSGGLSWGDFTTNGDETTSNTWGPDAQGRMWKWAEWKVDGDYSVNLTGGLYWVLCVGGGAWSYSQTLYTDQGQPGLVNEGYWEFPANDSTQIKVGKKGDKGAGGANADNGGQPSSIGDYGTQGFVTWGQRRTGRGSKSYQDNLGYKSFITGTGLEYAPGADGLDRPGRSGDHNDTQVRDGCVIIATAAPNAKALNWVHTTYHAEVSDGTVTAVYTQKHYADGKTTPLPTGELVEASYGVSEGWLFVNGELQPPPTPPEPTRDELIAELQARIVELQNNTK